jgi:hypothetical protein
VPRQVSDWISGYLEYTKGSEPPTSYHTWIGLSLIAAALQRKVYFHWGFETIYPNMYVVLVGPSGRTRKGVALGIGKDLLSEVAGVVMAAEATTREALIKLMKDNAQSFNDPSMKRIRWHCSITGFSEELSVFLGQNDLKFLSNLTDWYDCKDKWTYETIGRGRDFVNGVCFNFCGATAPDWLQSILPQEAIGGGYTSRNIYICEEQKGFTSPKHVLTSHQMRLREALVADLARINTLAGEFKFDPSGEQAYVRWYTEYDAALKRGDYPVDDPRFAYYAERRATHIRKLMMVLSASRGDTMRMSLQDFDRANKLLKAAELKMHRTFGGLGRAKGAIDAQRVLDYVQSMTAVSRADILSKFYRDVGAAEFKAIEELMIQMNVVDVTVLKSGDKVYKWKPKK